MLATFPVAGLLHADELKYADQGRDWTGTERADFYARDQGSRLVPYAWLKALKHPDGTGFLDDSLTRYGYLPNPSSPTPGLPVGFTVSEGGGKIVGLTCAACHARQIDVNGTSWRIDGGPAIVDFQGFLDDLDKAFYKVVHDDAAFRDFASRVGDTNPNVLRNNVSDWFDPFHILIKNSLPDRPWGLGRLDAVSMIFNRVAGLEIGTSPRIIEANMKKADAAVRYPFLWNAPKQDQTQWPGFSPNGDDVTALGPNVGEVLGVFGVFHPVHIVLDNTSVNFRGLLRLENLVKKKKSNVPNGLGARMLPSSIQGGSYSRRNVPGVTKQQQGHRVRATKKALGRLSVRMWEPTTGNIQYSPGALQPESSKVRSFRFPLS
jgi:hypothetical protein